MKVIDYLILLSLILASLMIPTVVFAENEILINEFMIEPQPQSIEIINNGMETIDISHWYLDDSGGSTFYTISDTTYLSPQACLVFSGDFNLNKASADTVRLFDATAPPTADTGHLIDSFSYTLSPGAGLSFYRSPDDQSNWITGASSLGKFNDDNQSCLIQPTLTPTLSPTPIPTPLPSPSEPPSPTIEASLTPSPFPSTPANYTNIFLSEAMVYPENGANEWVELYNDNDYDLILDNWFLDDVENAGSSPRLFSLSIKAKGLAVIDLTSSVFNNDGDDVRLLDPNKTLKDSFEYKSSRPNQTLGKSDYRTDQVCFQNPTKNQVNSVCLTTSINSTPTSTVNITSILTSYVVPTTVDNRHRVISSPQLLPGALYPLNINKPTAVTKENILGATTLIKKSTNRSLHNALFFASTGYSLLAIGSIFMKIGQKNRFVP